MSRRGWLLFVAVGIIWGVPYLLIKVAVGTLSPASLVFWRTVLAALLLLPLAATRGQFRPLLRHWVALPVFAAVEIAIPWLFLATAEQRLTSSLAGLLIAAVPMVGALLAWATGGERLGPLRQLGLLVGLAGVAALVGLDLHARDAWALVEMAIVVVGYAVGPFLLTRYLSDLPSLGVTAASLGLTALVYLPFAVLQLPAHWPAWNVTGSVVGLAVVCTAAAFLLFFALIAEVGPVRATVITYINPAVAVALGVALLGEPFTVGVGVGFALVLAGSVLATRRTRAAEPSAAGTGGRGQRDSTGIGAGGQAAAVGVDVSGGHHGAVARQ
jgi:drug/metabolite transporter (DMT)-like permease